MTVYNVITINNTIWLKIPKHTAQNFLVRKNALPHIRKLPYNSQLSRAIYIIVLFPVSSLMTLKNLLHSFKRIAISFNSSNFSTSFTEFSILEIELYYFVVALNPF